MKFLKGKQSGQALVLALALLGLGSLMIAPMLSFMGTGLNASSISEIKMDELYACDAGVQDAIWQINHLGEPGAIPYTYLDGSDEFGNPLLPEVYDYSDAVIGRTLPNVNENDVFVRITLWELVEGFGRYQVQAWVGSESWINASTKIDAIIVTTWLDYGHLLDNAITSPGEVNLQPGSNVVGGIVCPEVPTGSGTYDEHTPNDVAIWPTAEEIMAYYQMDVDMDNPYPDTEIDLNGVNSTLGPVYIDNDFIMKNTAGAEAVLTLTGTVYITGQTSIGGSKDWILDLNGNTIFVEDNTSGGGTALDIRDTCTLIGNGCIVAIGDIYFSPKTGTNPDDFIFVISIDGETNFNPKGDFEGAVAGNVNVNLQPGCEVNWHQWPDLYGKDIDGDGIPDPPPDGQPDLNFPGGSGGGGMIWGVHTWSYWTIGDEIP